MSRETIRELWKRIKLFLKRFWKKHFTKQSPDTGNPYYGFVPTRSGKHKFSNIQAQLKAFREKKLRMKAARMRLNRLKNRDANND